MTKPLLPPDFEIKVGIHGVGVFITKDVKKGSILFKMKGEVLDRPTRTSVQIGKNKHIEDKLAGHINHSCTPNAKVMRRSHAFISVKDIQAGEEITFDYNDNEDRMSSPFQCACCGNTIRGKHAKTVREIL